MKPLCCRLVRGTCAVVGPPVSAPAEESLMHPLHDYVAKQLTEKLKAKKLVVWYDPRQEFVPFVGEVRGGVKTGSGTVSVTVGGIVTRLAEYDGSMFELRAV